MSAADVVSSPTLPTAAKVEEIPPIATAVRTQPDQPIYYDESGSRRYQKNEVVRYLLDCYAGDLESLLQMRSFPQADITQFTQLIGFASPVERIPEGKRLAIDPDTGEWRFMRPEDPMPDGWRWF